MTGNSIILEDMEVITSAPIDWRRLSGKTFLISGANGFLPAYLVETLLFLNKKGIAEDIKVLALVRNFEKAKKRFNHYLDDKNLEFIIQDVCETVKIQQKIHYFIHAASQASPKYYSVDPVGTLSANILGTIKMLELARENDAEAFLYFSSSEVYGSLESTKIPTKETSYGYLDPLNIRSCYAESKRMGENICISWAHQFGVPVKIVRPFHTYGPGMALNDGRVYADFISDILAGNDIIIKSDGSARRAFCYLSDATLGFFTVLLNGAIANAYNVGNPLEEISIKELAIMLADIFQEKNISVKMNPVFNSPYYLPSSVDRIQPDISKIAELGWKPEIDIKKGFKRTVLSYL